MNLSQLNLPQPTRRPHSLIAGLRKLSIGCGLALDAALDAIDHATGANFVIDELINENEHLTQQALDLNVALRSEKILTNDLTTHNTTQAQEIAILKQGMKSVLNGAELESAIQAQRVQELEAQIRELETQLAVARGKSRQQRGSQRLPSPSRRRW